MYIQSKAYYIEDSVTKIQILTKHMPIMGCVLQVMYTWWLYLCSFTQQVDSNE